MKELRPENRLNLDYTKAAAEFRPLDFPIIDAHTHINGGRAAEIYKQVTALFGVQRTYSMTRLIELPDVRRVLGDSINFIAVPDFVGGDPLYNHGKGYCERIREFHLAGATIAKFFAAPRLLGGGAALGDRKLFWLTSPLRRETMQVAYDLGMLFMTHVGDPDTWFATKYSDQSLYGSKREQYDQLEESLLAFPCPWIAAHMGGWPEDLNFLSGLLERHSNLYLDTSATKWMVRELSKHSRDSFLSFLERWRGRILFGSDIVTDDTHLEDRKDKSEVQGRASSQMQAFDLYASRYYALRTLFETGYDGQSPIADPDLAMVEPQKYLELDAPKLIGKSLPQDLLRVLYFEAAHKLFAKK